MPCRRASEPPRCCWSFSCWCRSISARWSPGLRAGLIYNTWPLIDGALVPDLSRLWFEQPWWRNFFENALTVQFNHRMLAYAIFVLAILHVADVARTARGGTALTGALVLAAPSRCRPRSAS